MTLLVAAHPGNEFSFVVALNMLCHVVELAEDESAVRLA
jgi:hypothetical protein